MEVVRLQVTAARSIFRSRTHSFQHYFDSTPMNIIPYLENEDTFVNAYAIVNIYIYQPQNQNFREILTNMPGIK